MSIQELVSYITEQHQTEMGGDYGRRTISGSLCNYIIIVRQLPISDYAVLGQSIQVTKYSRVKK